MPEAMPTKTTKAPAVQSIERADLLLNLPKDWDVQARKAPAELKAALKSYLKETHKGKPAKTESINTIRPVNGEVKKRKAFFFVDTVVNGALTIGKTDIKPVRGLLVLAEGATEYQLARALSDQRLIIALEY